MLLPLQGVGLRMRIGLRQCLKLLCLLGFQPTKKNSSRPLPTAVNLKSYFVNSYWAQTGRTESPKLRLRRLKLLPLDLINILHAANE